MRCLFLRLVLLLLRWFYPFELRWSTPILEVGLLWMPLLLLCWDVLVGVSMSGLGWVQGLNMVPEVGAGAVMWYFLLRIA